MKNILGLVASRRKIANGEILLKEACSAVREAHHLELVKLSDLRLETCRGCFTCLMPGKKCPLNDDLYALAEKIKAADGIILAAPCYVLGPAAVTKILGDRMVALTQMLNDFWGKPCAIIATAGSPGWEGYTLSALVALVRCLGLDVKDANLFVGALPGEAIMAPGAMERVKSLGSRLFGEARPPKQGECPSCWSDIWKFPQPGSALCPVCGQRAEVTAGYQGVRWLFGPAGERFGKRELETHNLELKEKIKEYLERRSELAEIQNRYRK